MLEDHPLELAHIKAGLAQIPVPEKIMAQRKRIFWPVYGVMGTVFVAGIITFATFEPRVAATQPPAETVVVSSPLTSTPLPTLPPRPTLAPTQVGSTAPSTWEGGIGAMFEKCTGCHGAGTQSSGLNLASYQSALAGGASGPGIVPGNPDASGIVKKQSAGNHFAQFSDQELAIIRQWIQAGAPEK